MAGTGPIGASSPPIAFTPGDESSKAAALKKTQEAAGKGAHAKDTNEVFLIDEKAGTITIMDRATFKAKTEESGFNPAGFSIDVESVDGGNKKAGAEALKYADSKEAGGKAGQLELATVKSGLEALGYNAKGESDPVKAFQKAHNSKMLCETPPNIAGLIKVDGLAKGETINAMRTDFKTEIAGESKKFSAAAAGYDKAVGEYAQLAIKYKACLDKKPADIEGAKQAQKDMVAKKAEIQGHEKQMTASGERLEVLGGAAKSIFTPDELAEKPLADQLAPTGPAKEQGAIDAADASIKDLKIPDPPKAPVGPAPATVKGDPDVNFKVVEDLNKAGDGDDDAGQVFVRCLSEPDEKKWSADDRAWLNEHGYKPSDLKKIGVEGLARIYQGIMTGSVTSGEQADGHKFMCYIRDKGLIDPFMAEMAKKPGAAKEMVAEHGKMGMLTYLAECKPETAKLYLDMGLFGPGDFKKAAEHFKAHPTLPCNPETLKVLGDAWAKSKPEPSMSDYRTFIEPMLKGEMPGKTAPVAPKPAPPKPMAGEPVLTLNKSKDGDYPTVTVPIGGTQLTIKPHTWLEGDKVVLEKDKPFTVEKADGTQPSVDELQAVLEKIKADKSMNESIRKQYEAALLEGIERKKK